VVTSWYDKAIKKRGFTFKEPAKKSSKGLSHEIEKSGKLFEKKKAEEDEVRRMSFRERIGMKFRIWKR